MLYFLCNLSQIMRGVLYKHKVKDFSSCETKLFMINISLIILNLFPSQQDWFIFNYMGFNNFDFKTIQFSCHIILYLVVTPLLPPKINFS